MRRRQLLCTAAFALAASSIRGQASQKSMTVYKDPSCGCCEAWANAMVDADFEVHVRPTDDLASIKDRMQVPSSVEGCHTAVADSYFIEGHVPLEAVERLLNERPDIRGLAVPGMPNGSLGMGDNPAVASYDVISVDKQGNTSVYMSVRPKV